MSGLREVPPRGFVPVTDARLYRVKNLAKSSLDLDAGKAAIFAEA
jgi:hypothetical protein